MANPVPELQQPTNKSIIELFSLELIPDLHFAKTAMTPTYSQSGTTITVSQNGHGMPVGTIIPLNFTSGNAIDGIYTIQTESTNEFTVTATVSQTTSGNLTMNVNQTPTVPVVYLFHSGNNMKDSTDIVWQSNTYTKFPCEATGFKYSGKGTLPRPNIIFSNLLGSITTILQLVNETTPFIDLQGAKVTRRRTLVRFLDEVNFPSNVNPYKAGSVDPTAELPQEIYFIDKKSIENRDIVQFEMVSSFDLSGVSAPKKLVTKDDFPSVGRFVNF